MSIEAIAPKVTGQQVGAVMANPVAVITLDLATGAVAVDANPTDEVWTGATHLVLVTYDDVMAAAATAVGCRKFVPAIVRRLNAEVKALAEAGELPTADDVAATLAEIAQWEAEQGTGATVIPLFGDVA